MRTMTENGGYRRRLFGTILLKKDKPSIQTIIKKRSPRNMEFDAKGVPNWSQHRCQHSSKTNAKTGNETVQENHQKSCFSGKNIEIHCEHTFFDGLESCRCERETYQHKH